MEKILTAKLSDTREAIIRKLIDILAVYRSTIPAGSAPSSQLVYPDALSNLPLYMLALVKNIVFRGGTDIRNHVLTCYIVLTFRRPDDRVTHMMMLRTMPVEETTIFVHPRLYSLTTLTPEVINYCNIVNG